jgi:hypothetical protein
MNPEERQLEARLRRLVPASHNLQRDRLMFQAGHRAAHRRSLPWQAASAALFVGCLVLGWQNLGLEPGPAPSPIVQLEPAVDSDRPELVARPPVPAAVVPQRHSHPSDYFRLRELVLLNGADALPSPPASPITEPADASRNWPPGMPSLLPGFRRSHPVFHGDPS